MKKLWIWRLWGRRYWHLEQLGRRCGWKASTRVGVIKGLSIYFFHPGNTRYNLPVINKIEAWLASKSMFYIYIKIHFRNGDTKLYIYWDFLWIYINKLGIYDIGCCGCITLNLSNGSKMSLIKKSKRITYMWDVTIQCRGLLWCHLRLPGYFSCLKQENGFVKIFFIFILQTKTFHALIFWTS